MTEFLLELYVPKTMRDAAPVTAKRFGDAAAELTAEHRPVRLVHSIFACQDETCYLLVEAATVADVREAARRAALPFEHVVEAAVDVEHRAVEDWAVEHGADPPAAA
jgi:hypothetical protein